MSGMPYDKKSFLTGLAIGRNMESWPALEGPEMGVFSFSVEMSADSLTYQFRGYLANVIAYWGDGQSSYYTYTIPDYPDFVTASHTYAEPGIYCIYLVGDMYSLLFGGVCKDNLISINSIFPKLPDDLPRPYVFANSGVKPIVSFGGCVNLSSVPDRFFQNYSGDQIIVKDVSGIFSGSGIVEIPPDIFAADCFSYVETAQSVFSGCPMLEEIPPTLFNKFRQTIDFRWIFSECTSLTSVPANLFRNCQAAELFTYAFSDCRALSDVPDGFFSGLENAIDFTGVFGGCGLTKAPNRCFSGCISAVDFSDAFGSNPMTTIGNGVFAGCESAEIFKNCFSYCRQLTYAPSDLFDDCRGALNFIACFEICEALEHAIPLWVTHPNASGRACYWGCYNLDNFYDVPNAWKYW